ncbi:MAG TPA: type II toxin-antitoxin system HicA family toxin [Chloroflexia bacterium]|jgi:predicted RNA binding protein YcfA (HicA-like mRNA interferase family)
MPIKVREAIRQIEDDGWVMLPRKGTNHRQFKHPVKAGRVTISGNPGNDLSIKDQRSIEQQAGIRLK